ncbi:hypothetical protein ADUPG1_013500, partial [Aduncisulcus paluster]
MQDGIHEEELIDDFRPLTAPGQIVGDSISSHCESTQKEDTNPDDSSRKALGQRKNASSYLYTPTTTAAFAAASIALQVEDQERRERANRDKKESIGRVKYGERREFLDEDGDDDVEYIYKQTPTQPFPQHRVAGHGYTYSESVSKSPILSRSQMLAKKHIQQLRDQQQQHQMEELTEIAMQTSGSGVGHAITGGHSTEQRNPTLAETLTSSKNPPHMAEYSCPVHPTSPHNSLCMYCMQCGRLVCYWCCRTCCSTHQLKDVKDIAAEKREEYNMMVKQILLDAETIEDQNDRLKLEIDQLKQRLSELETEYKGNQDRCDVLRRLSCSLFTFADVSSDLSVVCGSVTLRRKPERDAFQLYLDKIKDRGAFRDSEKAKRGRERERDGEREREKREATGDDQQEIQEHSTEGEVGADVDATTVPARSGSGRRSKRRFVKRVRRDSVDGLEAGENGKIVRVVRRGKKKRSRKNSVDKEEASMTEETTTEDEDEEDVEKQQLTTPMPLTVRDGTGRVGRSGTSTGIMSLVSSHAKGEPRKDGKSDKVEHHKKKHRKEGAQLASLLQVKYPALSQYSHVVGPEKSPVASFSASKDVPNIKIDTSNSLMGCS